jgi:hypothetical protein
MDEQKTQEAARETTRRMQETARRGQERTQEASQEAGRMAGQMAGLATDTLTVWTQVNQQVVHEMMELSTGAAQHGARLLADLQQANMQGLQDWQAGNLRWWAMWPEAFRDPVRCYQRMFEESLNGANRAFGLGQRNAEAVTQSFERMRSSADETARGLQEAFRDASHRMQDVFQRAERLRAA